MTDTLPGVDMAHETTAPMADTEDLQALEAALVRAAQTDLKAFSPLYQRYRDRIYRYLRTRTSSDEDAADLTQQVFLQALDALPRYRIQQAPFAAWLTRIARNLAVNGRRQRKRTVQWDSLPEALQPLAEGDLDDQVLRDEALAQLRLALQTLNTSTREVLALHFAAGLTVAETAAVVGRSEAAVKKQLTRTLHVLKERYRDEKNEAPGAFVEQDDPTLAGTLTDLERLYAAPFPLHLGAGVDRVIYERMDVLRQASASASHVRATMRVAQFDRTHWRVTKLAAAVVVTLSAVVAYAWFGGQPASAQAVLRRASSFHLATNQTAHLTYNVTLKGHAGVADVWAQADASGTPVRAAQTLTMNSSGKGGATAMLSSRYVEVGQQIYLYDPGHNAILLTPEAREDPSWILPPDTFFGVNVAEELNTLAQQSPRRVQLLSQRTLDGHLVDAVEVNGWFNQLDLRTTFYFDASSGLLRGFDSVLRSTSQSKWQVRLATEETVATAPPQAFLLNAPATARVVAPDLTLSTFITVCHPTTQAKALLISGMSPLAICQQRVPTMTAADLTAALLAPQRTAVHAAATAGQITSAQEADCLAALQERLAAWVVTSGGASAK